MVNTRGERQSAQILSRQVVGGQKWQARQSVVSGKSIGLGLRCLRIVVVNGSRHHSKGEPRDRGKRTERDVSRDKAGSGIGDPL